MKLFGRKISFFAVLLGAILIVFLVGWVLRELLPEPTVPAIKPSPQPPAVVEAELSPQEHAFSLKFWQSATLNSFKELQSAGVDFKAFDDQGWTPLMYAAVSCIDTDVMTQVIAYSGDLFYRAEDGSSLLTLIRQNETLKNTDLHKNIENWHQNELHYQMALKAEIERKNREELEKAGTDLAAPPEEASDSLDADPQTRNQ